MGDRPWNCSKCKTPIEDDEYVVNWGSCNECFDADYLAYLDASQPLAGSFPTIITGPQFTLSRDGRDVDLWCAYEGINDQGNAKFYVLNGCWDGTFDGENVVVLKTGSEWPAKVTWEGKAPFSEHRYNEAIAWIRDQIAPLHK